MTETEHLANQIVAALRATVPPERRLWSKEDVGDYLGVSARHVAERLACRPDFPSPIRLPGTGQRGLLRWKAGEVMRWAERL